MPNRSAVDVRSIFADNLRVLGERHGTVSEICQATGVNRTQYHRFLSGTSFPRPDVLDRLCQYFGVDARILTEKLENIQFEGTSKFAHLEELEQVLPPSVRYNPKSGLQPGIYRFWKVSFRFEKCVALTLVHFYVKNGMLKIKGRTSFNLPDEAENRNHRKTALQYDVQKIHGVGFHEEAGLVYHMREANDELPILVGFVSHDSYPPGVFAGYTCLVQNDLAGQNRLVRCVFERVPAGFSHAKQARLKIGVYREEQIPEAVRFALKMDSPLT